ncbi:MAG: helix-turn-helix transcriptional regulator [bacterium]
MYVTKKIKELLKEKNLSQNELARMINYSHGAFSTILNGKAAFPKHIIEKIAPILEVSKEEIQGWILADKYPKETIMLAVQTKKEKELDNNQLILTTKIDNILKSKRMSRTALSKLIGYSQGGLNEMIIGKEPLSKNVIKKISPILEVSESEIQSWILADKYSLQTLEEALKNYIFKKLYFL